MLHPDFLKTKIALQIKNLDLTGGESANYNQLFCTEELENAVSHTRDTAPGPDNLHICLIKQALIML